MRPFHRTRISLQAVALLLLATACSTPVGQVTIINTEEAPLKGTIGEAQFAVKPAKSWTTDLPEGPHNILFADKKSVPVTVSAGRTTVVDRAGTACYVVVDYRKQYGSKPSPDVLIGERFKNKKTFTPADPLLVPFGRKLPQKIPEGSPARRLHTVDCALLGEKEKLAETLASLP